MIENIEFLVKAVLYGALVYCLCNLFSGYV